MHLFWIFASCALSLGGQIIDVEIARKKTEQQSGLSRRTTLGENNGMLFVYPTPRILSFWMKDTLIPLSVAFFDEKRRLIQIEDMEVTETGTLKIYRSRKPARYALEMNSGWFQKHNIGKGETFSGECL